MTDRSSENVRNISVFGGGGAAADYVEADAEGPETSFYDPRREISQLQTADFGLAPVAGAGPSNEDLAAESTSPKSLPLGTAESAVIDPLEGLRAAAHNSEESKARKGMRGALGRIGFSFKPNATELAEIREREVRRRNETVVRQATWTRAVSILIANPKGGTGKTPTALLIGGVLASIRGGSVAVVEVSDDPGALAFRAEGHPRLGIGELVKDVASIATAGQLAGYTAPQTSFAAVIGSTGRRERLTGEAVVDVSNVIDNFYAIRVMDSGNQPTSSAFQGAVSVADALIVPVMNAGDSALEAIRLLDELRSGGEHAVALARNAIILRLTDGRPENSSVTLEVSRLLEQADVAAVFEIPYDHHIADRSQISLASLGPATSDAFVAASAAVVRTLQFTAAETTRKV